MNYGSFPEALADKVRMHPDKVFIIEGDKRVTYRQHLAAALTLSERLREAGVKRGDNVVICTRQTASCLNAFMAAHILGAVVVPLEGGFPAARIIEIQEIAGASAIIDTAPVTENCPFIDVALAENIDDKYKNCDTGTLIAAMPEYPKPDDILSIMFTTGTTGKSKGVVLTVDSQMGVAENVRSYLYESNDIVLNPLSISHVFGIRRYQVSLVVGCTLVLTAKTMTPKPFFDAIKNHKVNIIAMTPAHASLILNYAGDKLGEIGAQLKAIEFSGSSIQERLKEMLISLLPSVKLISSYGSAESGPTCCVDLHNSKDKKYCLGIPVRSDIIYIGDSNGNPIAPGRENIGNIYITGRSVMKGYYGEPELTQSVLKNGYLKMSDMGYFDEDGFFYVFGRADDVICSGAYKISPLEIEDLAGQMPGIKECACVAVPDEVLGSVPKLFVVMNDGAEFSYKAVYEFLAARTESALLPRYIEQIDHLPRTFNGKISRINLASRKHC